MKLDEAINNSDNNNLVIKTTDAETVCFFHDGTIEVNGVLTTDNNLIVETLKSIIKKQNKL